MTHVCHDAVVQLQDSGGVTGSGTTLHGRSRVQLVLHVTVGWADVDLVQRQVRMTEDDDIGVREPAAQTTGSAAGGTAVMDGRDLTSVELDNEPFGKVHAAVVVPQHRMNGRELLERRQHGRVDDVARVDNDVGRLEVAAQPLHEAGSLALAQMTVGEHQHVHRRYSLTTRSHTLTRMPGFCPELVGSMSEGAAGNPTGAMMEAAFAHHDLAWRYVNLEVAATALGDAVRGSRAMGFRGFNCSMPHKVAVIEHLDGLAASASVIGAVNCVVREGERLVGHNTDGEGFLRALGERVNVRGTRIVVLGAGGAARAIAVELGLAGCAEVTIINRDEGRGTALAELVAANTSSRAVWKPWIGDVLVPLGTDVLVNATSVGLYAPDDRPAIDIPSLGNAALVADVVFNPVDTRLLRDAATLGCETLDGLGMLVHQGAAAIERWVGISPDRHVMRDALAEALTR